MKTNTAIKVKVIYSIIMAVLATACLVSIILTWYKADKPAVYVLFIPIIVGYAAAIYVYLNRKPIY